MVRTLFVAALVALAACEGPQGPTGPAGPQGPEGPQGPAGSVQSRLGQVNASGSASVVFAGLRLDRSVVNCWVADNPTSATWLAVAFDAQTGLSCGATTQGGNLFVSVINAPAGWSFLATVVTGG